MQLVVMQGVSGAGKDYFIRRSIPVADTVASADDWFMVDNVYRFDPARLPQAHAACLRTVITALQRGDGLVIVNNTNTSQVEIAPYMAVAQAYGAVANIISLTIDPVIAAARTTHGAPLEVIQKMAERMARTLRELPPWWDIQKLTWDVETAKYR